MVTHKTKWVLVGLVCLAAAAVAYMVLQGGPWGNLHGRRRQGV